MKRRAGFVEPMLLLRASELLDGPEWLKELKLDGYCAVASKTGGKIQLRSRNDRLGDILRSSKRYPVCRMKR